MKKSKRNFMIVLVISLVVLSLTPVFGQGISKTIKAMFNSVTIFVEGKQVSTDNFVYDKTTYVPLKSISELTGFDVNWDDETRRIDLTIKNNNINNPEDNNKYNFKNTDGVHKILNYSPMQYEDDSYLMWNYMDIMFDAPTKNVVDVTKVVLLDNKGKRFDVICKPGSTDKNAFLVIPQEELELNTYYSVYIPKNSIEFENGDLYGEDIQMYFKTATNVLKGTIDSDEILLDEEIKIYNDNNFECIKSIIGKNEFYFTNLPDGVYSIIVNEKTYDNILVEANKVNEVTLMEAK
ncbi:hypothetical protein JYG23_12690 [Sedimentibacter sp. zth1]|uniref:stalk domain-containing protein n=1 Tax=Sedimentibacter sp. zth1 TaxID=2816908 RepID=UPI001A91BB55|nr:stalk domain-containing protein [Sedimentibacter sp. zth1]QSX05520.1 hypothetical protein JYG23_12690 [Sedimentibacter sp. zth1]